MGFSTDYARKIGLQFYGVTDAEDIDNEAMKKALSEVERRLSGVKFRNRDLREFATFVGDAQVAGAGAKTKDRMALQMGKMIGDTYDFVSVLEAGLDVLELLKVTSGPVYNGIVSALQPDDE